MGSVAPCACCDGTLDLASPPEVWCVDLMRYVRPDRGLFGAPYSTGALVSSNAVIGAMWAYSFRRQLTDKERE